MEPPFPLKTNASTFYPPVPEVKRAKPMGPPLDHMKMFIGVALLVAIIGFVMWRNKQPPPPPTTTTNPTEEMERNISSLSREVSRLQKALASKLDQDQKLATLEQSQRLVLQKLDQLSQRKRSPPSSPQVQQQVQNVAQDLPAPPPL